MVAVSGFRGGGWGWWVSNRARCDSGGCLQEETPPEAKGEKPQPSKDEDRTGEELQKKDEEVKEEQPKPGNSLFGYLLKDLHLVSVQK